MTFDANDAATGVDGIRREILTWDEFGDAARGLAGDVLRSGFQPDVVIAIARGGLLLAGAISYALGTKACGSINVEFYSGIDERLPEPVLHPPMLDAPALGGKRVLLVAVPDPPPRSGLDITMLAQRSPAIPRADAVAANGALKTPYRSLRFGTDRP